MKSFTDSDRRARAREIVRPRRWTWLNWLLGRKPDPLEVIR